MQLLVAERVFDVAFVRDLDGALATITLSETVKEFSILSRSEAPLIRTIQSAR